jgi:hypothetical protein
VRWYDDVFDLHRIPVRIDDGLWAALGPPPPWHSAVKTLEPGIDAARVLEAASRFEHCAVADSFGDLDLRRHGFEVLLDATWLQRAPVGAGPATLPQGWSVVDDEETLTAWGTAHDYDGVLLPTVLHHPRFRILACRRQGVLVGGAVSHDAGDTVGLSNAWGAGRFGESDEVLAAVSALCPGRAVSDFAEGSERDAMVAAGFTPLGPQRIWIR